MSQARVDLSKAQFDELVEHQGLNFKHEKAIPCHCIESGGHSLPDCGTCGGEGYKLLAPVDIKAIAMSLGINMDRQGFGQIWSDTMFVSARAEGRLSYYDRLTLMDAKIVYAEKVFAEQDPQALRYPVIDIEYLGDRDDKEYIKGTDFDIVDEKIDWITTVPREFIVRYLTYPRWVVLNFPHVIRGTITGTKKITNTYEEMPVQAQVKLEFRITDEDVGK